MKKAIWIFLLCLSGANYQPARARPVLLTKGGYKTLTVMIIPRRDGVTTFVVSDVTDISAVSSDFSLPIVDASKFNQAKRLYSGNDIDPVAALDAIRAVMVNFRGN